MRKDNYELFRIIQIGLGIIGIGLLIAIIGYILVSK